MHLHGGRIGVFSEGEGKGTEFVADLPIFRIDTNPLRTGKNGSKAKQLVSWKISISLILFIFQSFSCIMRFFTRN